jgi:hypothetical protein
MGHYLGSLVGTGRIIVGDRDHGEVTFSIGVKRDDDLMSGKGVLSGNTAAIGAAFAFGRARLSLPGGEVVDIAVHEVNQRRGLFTVDGRIPGF